MNQFFQQRQLTRAQSALMNPVNFSTDKAEILAVIGKGLTKDRDNIDLMTVVVRVMERPGQPIRVTAKDCFARQLAELAESKSPFSFEGNVSGNPTPYVFVTHLEAFDQD